MMSGLRQTMGVDVCAHLSSGVNHRGADGPARKGAAPVCRRPREGRHRRLHHRGAKTCPQAQLREGACFCARLCVHDRRDLLSEIFTGISYPTGAYYTSGLYCNLLAVKLYLVRAPTGASQVSL